MRWNIVNKFIKDRGFKKYLEIGVYRKQMYNKIICEHKECVDPDSNANATHTMTSDDFFGKYSNNRYDIIFIDGLHHSDTVDRDIRNSLTVLNDGGVIVLHDCNPSTEIHQRVPQESEHWNGDVWKSIVKFIHSEHKNYNIYTVDVDEGIGVIEPGSCECNFEMPDELNWDWLVSNRIECLNLIGFQKFLLDK